MARLESHAFVSCSDCSLALLLYALYQLMNVLLREMRPATHDLPCSFTSDCVNLLAPSSKEEPFIASLPRMPISRSLEKGGELPVESRNRSSPTAASFSLAQTAKKRNRRRL
jgi:hypothetical protein